MEPSMKAPLMPVQIKPMVTEQPGMTCLEYFKQDLTSLSLLKTSGAGTRRVKPIGVQEHILCTEGCMDMTYEGGSCRIVAGQGLLLQQHITVECSCQGSFVLVSVAAGVKEGMTTQPAIVEKVDVVDAPGITISEHFGKVASHDPDFSLARAVVRGASEEAFQAPLFDEFVVCDEGSIEFLYGEGERLKIGVGEGVFLPKTLRVKWIWPESTQYTVLCLPAFTPELSGREVEDGTTVAKDSASMAKLEALHAATLTA